MSSGLAPTTNHRLYYFLNCLPSCNTELPGILIRCVTVTVCRVSHIHSSAQLQEKWKLMSAVCLERFPVITQEMNSIENEFGQLLSKMELEQSHLSNHELRHLEDL